MPSFPSWLPLVVAVGFLLVGGVLYANAFDALGSILAAIGVTVLVVGLVIQKRR